MYRDNKYSEPIYMYYASVHSILCFLILFISFKIIKLIANLFLDNVTPHPSRIKSRLKPFARKVFDNTPCYNIPRLSMDMRTNVIVEVLTSKTLVDVVWAVCIL